MLSVLALRANEVTAVHPDTVLNERCHDVRRQALTIAHNGSLRLLAQVVYQEDTVIDTLQLVEELVYLIK